MTRALLLIFLPLLSAQAQTFPETGPVVPGAQAALRDGIAFAPAKAPRSIQRAIWAANQLRSKPYRFGGGHRSFSDSGYDCSATVSYAMAGAGLLTRPISSTDFCNYGARGEGHWLTIYARRGHTFAVIAGLRLDTTANSGRRWAPRWRGSYRPPRGFVARHPAGL